MTSILGALSFPLSKTYQNLFYILKGGLAEDHSVDP